jgi:antitoxin component YwqK of YwqJK toxin-antitoxin module
MKHKLLIIFFTILLTTIIVTIKSKNDKEQTISNKCDVNIINKKFVDGELRLQNGKKCQFHLPAEKRTIVTICNKDGLAMEFESHDLNLEKIINPNQRVVINIPVLEKGKIYEFFEEFYGYKCEFLAI